MTSGWPEPLQFGPWLLERRLAVSAMSEVWLGQRLGDTQTCAVKRVLPIHRGDATILALFRHEADVMRMLDDIRVPRLLDEGEVRGVPWLSMPYYPGASLQALSAEVQLAGNAARWLAGEVALALAAVHAAGQVHADVAPDNVLICTDGRVLLLDLGIAVPRGCRAPVRRGKAQYASPEQIGGEPLTEQTDLYALGKILLALGLDDAPTAYDAAALAQWLHAEVPDPVAAKAQLARLVSAVKTTVTPSPWEAAELRGEVVTDPVADEGATQTR